jgi:hypothetical protein
MRKKQKQPQQQPVTVEFEGKKYSATYTVDPGGVAVDSGWGSSTGHSSGSGTKAELFTALMLFREILHAAKARGKL